MKKAGMVLHCSKGIINLYIKNNLLTSMKIPTTNPLHRYQGTKHYNKIETKSLAKLINLMREHISHTLIPFEQSSYINNVILLLGSCLNLSNKCFSFFVVDMRIIIYLAHHFKHYINYLPVHHSCYRFVSITKSIQKV